VTGPDAVAEHNDGLNALIGAEAVFRNAFFRRVGLLFGNPGPFLAFCPDAREAGRSAGFWP